LQTSRRRSVSVRSGGGQYFSQSKQFEIKSKVQYDLVNGLEQARR